MEDRNDTETKVERVSFGSHMRPDLLEKFKARAKLERRTHVVMLEQAIKLLLESDPA